MKKLIPVFRPNYGSEEVSAVTRVLKSGWIGLGPKTAEFEDKFASYVGSRYAVALNSATAALHLSLIAAGIQKGDEVIVPSLTFASTAHVVMYLGAKPIFADVESDTLCIDPADVVKKITKKTKAIIPVHYGGHPCNLTKLQNLAAKYNLVIIEDAAHACGAEYKSHRIGGISPFTCFSFHAVKNLAVGDGGMITTNDKYVAEHLRRLRWLGINKSTWNRIEKVLGPVKNIREGYGWYYEIDELGYKCHMNDIAAALGLVQLTKLEIGNEKRRKLAVNYTNELAKLPGFSCPTVHSDVITAQHNYVIRYKKRDLLNLFLIKHNISTGVHYMPLHLHPFYRKIYPNLHLPITDTEWPKMLTLPLYPQLTATEQKYIIKTICDFARNN